MITLEPQKINQFEGSDIEIHCIAEGVPYPSITWQRDCFYGTCSELDKVIYTYPESTTKGTSIIKHTAIVANDTGSYTCEATNEYGIQRVSTELKVLSKWMYYA